MHCKNAMIRVFIFEQVETNCRLIFSSKLYVKQPMVAETHINLLHRLQHRGTLGTYQQASTERIVRYAAFATGFVMLALAIYFLCATIFQWPPFKKDDKTATTS